jgi:Zn-dependent membrane protease YugP
MAIVAHEIGHAAQDATRYPLMALRSALVPVTNIGSRLGFFVFLAGFWLSFTPLIWLGILMFASAFVFTLVTLPVELDASRRAMQMLTTSGLIVTNDDRQGARAVLNAAALTYVAAMLSSLMTLLYYIFLARGRRRN